MVGPMDGAGPRQSIKNATLVGLPAADSMADKPAATPADEHWQPLFAQTDDLRESGHLQRTATVGGAGGVPFENDERVVYFVAAVSHVGIVGALSQGLPVTVCDRIDPVQPTHEHLGKDDPSQRTPEIHENRSRPELAPRHFL